MKKVLPIIAAIIVGACGNAPTMPTQPAPTPEPPMPPAALATNGNLAVANCALSGQTYLCDYTGPAINSGSGCAQNIRGTTKTYRPKPFDTLINASTWTYTGIVRSGESFIYSGKGADIGTDNGWTYSTEFTWDNIRC